MKDKKKTTDAAKILHRRYIKGSKKRTESLQRERENLGIAEQVYNLRTQAGLSQKELADLVGTTPWGEEMYRGQRSLKRGR